MNKVLIIAHSTIFHWSIAAMFSSNKISKHKLQHTVQTISAMLSIDIAAIHNLTHSPCTSTCTTPELPTTLPSTTYMHLIVFIQKNFVTCKCTTCLYMHKTINIYLVNLIMFNVCIMKKLVWERIGLGKKLAQGKNWSWEKIGLEKSGLWKKKLVQGKNWSGEKISNQNWSLLAKNMVCVHVLHSQLL